MLKPGKDLYSKLYFGKFVPDVRAFRLKLVGRSKTNETVERIVPSLIQPQTFELNLPEKGSFVIAPSALSVINVTLYNYGKTQNFEVLVSDDKSFVADYTPRVATVWSNTSIVIQVSLLAKAATPDGTSSSVSVSAKIRSKSGPKEDLVNFIVFHVAVYSKVRLQQSGSYLELCCVNYLWHLVLFSPSRLIINCQINQLERNNSISPNKQ